MVIYMANKYLYMIILRRFKKQYQDFQQVNNSRGHLVEKCFNLCAEITRKRIMFASIFFVINMLFLIPSVILSFQLLPQGIGDSVDISRDGYVEGNYIRYVQNEIKYISLEEAGLNPAMVSEGQKVELAFNKQDEFIGARTYADINKMAGPLSFLFAMTLLVCPTSIGIARNWNGGEFTFSELKNKTFYLHYDGSAILLHRVIPSGRYDEGSVLIKIRRIKQYSSGVTRIWGRIHIPSQNREEPKKFWVMNDDPFYSKLTEVLKT